MSNETALDDLMTSALDRVGSADILVGIPSYRNAGTIGHVVRTVVQGLRTSFQGMRAVVVNADGGSNDGTTDVVREALDGQPAIVGAYRGLPGKGSAFRAIFEAAAELGVGACAVVDSDLRSITPQWIERLLGPVASGHTDYVTPLYARHKHDGTITNTIAYPLTRALYGKRVRQPIGGEFGFTGELARAFLAGGALVPRERRPRRGPPGAQTEARSDEVEHLGRASGSPASEVGMSDEVEHPSASEGSPRASVGKVWESDVARFGIDVYMTTTALARGARVSQAFLGAKIHDPKDPGADLAPMFTQVVGTAFRLAAANAERWRAASGSTDVPLIGDVRAVEPEEIRVDRDVLVRRFRDAAPDQLPVWEETISRAAMLAIRSALEADVPRALRGTTWATIVYDLLVASARRPDLAGVYVRSLVPLYFGRVAAFIEDARDLTTAEAERLVEEQAVAFEDRLPHLRERWGTGPLPA